MPGAPRANLTPPTCGPVSGSAIPGTGLDNRNLKRCPRHEGHDLPPVGAQHRIRSGRRHPAHRRQGGSRPRGRSIPRAHDLRARHPPSDLASRRRDLPPLSSRPIRAPLTHRRCSFRRALTPARKLRRLAPSPQRRRSRCARSLSLLPLDASCDCVGEPRTGPGRTRSALRPTIPTAHGRRAGFGVFAAPPASRES